MPYKMSEQAWPRFYRTPLTFFKGFIFVMCSRMNWLRWPVPLCNIYSNGHCVLSRRFHFSIVWLQVICAGALQGGDGGRVAGCGECRWAVKTLQSPEWLLALEAEEDLLPWPRPLQRHTQRLQPARRPFGTPLSQAIPLPSNQRNIWKLSGDKYWVPLRKYKIYLYPKQENRCDE